jgi:elongation factor G
VHGLGALHLEIVEGRLRDEFDVCFEFGQRRVSYREGLGFGEPTNNPDSDLWVTEVAGRHAQVIIKFSLRPLRDDEIGDPAWDGNIIVDKDGKPIRPDISTTIERKPQRYLARGIATALSSSPHTSLSMTHVHVQVNLFSCPINVDPSIAASAAAVLLRKRILDVGMGPVMEPYIRIKVIVNEDSLGFVIKDLIENGGEVSELSADSILAKDTGEEIGPFTQDGVYIPPDAFSTSTTSYSKNTSATPRLKRTLYAIAPLSKMLDFSSRLRALSGGHGLFEMANAGFKIVSESRKLEILKEVGRL